MKFIKPSYDEVRSNAMELYGKLQGSGWLPDVNVGVGRGGLFVLRCLQDFYIAAGVKIPYIVPSVERYAGINSVHKIRIKHLGKRDIEGRRVLIVDDVSDQGDSLIKMVDSVKKRGAREVKTATIHFKPWSKLKPDYYVKETDAWIIYPWELYETIRLLVERSSNAPAQEAYEELAEDAHITEDEFLSFCSVALGSSALPDETQLRIRRIRELYEAGRGSRGTVQKSFNPSSANS